MRSQGAGALRHRIHSYWTNLRTQFQQMPAPLFNFANK
ncbi:hypothetical protein NIES4075_20430 [Tolypothrix sp. NIES-4075]|nr:hypothetical protein NIES4075_20430 [Tolypothrix sp. NIES-4075]